MAPQRVTERERTKMARVENKHAPSFDGWLIAAGIAFVATGAAHVAGGFGNEFVGLIAVLVFLVAAVFLVMPWGGESKHRLVMSHPAVTPVAAPAVAPAALMQAPTKIGPERLSAPRHGKADALTEIEGIGPAMAKLCNDLGFYHFSQIAGWSDADVAWVDANMGFFKGRIVRDKWVAQARLIVSEGLDAFRVRTKTNDY